MEKLEMITVETKEGYKFPLLINQKNKCFEVPIAFLREVLNKKLKAFNDNFELHPVFIFQLSNWKTKKISERNKLVNGLERVWDMIIAYGFEKALEGLKNPKLLDTKIIGKTRFADKDILSNIDLEDIKRNAVKVKWEITGGGGGNGNPSDNSSATGNSGSNSDANGSAVAGRQGIIFYANALSYADENKKDFDPIIQIKESEARELHQKAKDFDKLKLENESLKLKCFDLKTDCQLKDSEIESLNFLIKENQESAQKIIDSNMKVIESYQEKLKARAKDFKEEIEDKTRNIDRLVNSVNRTAKELDLTKSIYKDIIKSLVKG